MKPSKSKLALAKVINENGGWVDDSGGEFAAQCTDGHISFWCSKPSKSKGEEWCGYGYTGFQYEIKNIPMMPNWHQTLLSREEYYQAYPKADVDGWIEWQSPFFGEMPVCDNEVVDIRVGDDIHTGFVAKDWKMWGVVTHYRLHKQDLKQEPCESVMRSIPEPELDDAESRLTKALELVKACAPHLLSDKYKFNGDEAMGERKPTIEQLARDYRNKLDFANRKQLEAEDSKAVADAALGELERAGEALGLMIGIAKRDLELVINDWRDLKIGDFIYIGESPVISNCPAGEYVICAVDENDESQPIKVCWNGDGAWPEIKVRGWKLIRRP